MGLPKQDRNRTFMLLKRKGIMVNNMKTIGSKPLNTNELIRERRRNSKTLEDKLIYCSKCFGFFSKTYFHRHRRSCHMNEHSIYLPFAVQPENAALDNKDDEKFTSEILDSLYSDDVGRLCKEDPIIKSYGKKKFRKLLTKKMSDKYDDKRTTIRSEMRRLAHLFNEFKNVCDTNKVRYVSSLDMYKRENFYLLEEALENISTREDGSIKAGLKKDLGYLIKRVCKFLHGKFSVEQQDDKISQIRNFLDVLTFYWHDTFGEAESLLVLNRQTSLRKPVNLPKQQDVKKLRDLTLSQIKELTESDYNFIASSDYTKLRNLVVSRLTLFNARRGGEPCCLQLSQWNDAENGIWLGENDEIEDPLEQALLGKFKIAYQSGKGGKLVSLLVPDDCWAAIRKLCDPEIREQAGVHLNNNFVFPHTQYSLNHVSGWTAVTECCSLAGLHKPLNATGMRHFVATLYAGLEIEESERETFYSHMGHSKSINRDVYQSPLARKTIKRVGKFLHDVDNGTNVHTSTENNDEQLQRADNDKEYHEDLGEPEGEKCEEVNENTLQSSPHRTGRQYKVWTKDDTETVRDYFSGCILSTENLETNKGSLPDVGELKKFLADFPNILQYLPKNQRIGRLRSKIFNERKLTREKIRRTVRTAEAKKKNRKPEKGTVKTT